MFVITANVWPEWKAYLKGYSVPCQDETERRHNEETRPPRDESDREHDPGHR